MPKRSLFAKFKEWRAERKEYPVVRLSYKQRVGDDVEALYKSEGGEKLFDDKYIVALTQTAEQIEARELKLIAYQIPITIFMILTLISGNNIDGINNANDINIFNISLGKTPGVKELLVFLATTITLGISFLTQAKQLRLAIISKVVELQTKKTEFLDFAKLANKTEGFDLQVYMGKQYRRWIFPTFRTKFLTDLHYLLVIIWILALFPFLWFLNAYFTYLIYQTPVLGNLSYAVIGYWIVVNSCVILSAIRTNAPLSYRNKGEVARKK